MTWQGHRFLLHYAVQGSAVTLLQSLHCIRGQPPTTHTTACADSHADGDGLDLLSYVEFQRNYMACVRQHKAALLTQRAFWNSLLRDTISFRDLQANAQAMDAAEERATSVYRR